MTNVLPTDGQTDWGDPLNTYITTVVLAEANATATSLANHQANSPADPHGDRAYTQTLFLPITQNVNLPGGFVQLTGEGLIPAAVQPVPDTWHDLRPVGTAFAVATGNYPPQYRQTLNGGVQIAGYIATTGTSYNGALALANALPSGVRPSKPVSLPVTVSAAGTGATLATAMMTIAANGNVTVSGLPAGLASGTVIGLYGWYPLDASYGLIES